MGAGAPKINISFREKSVTALTRGERGIVMLLVKDTLPENYKNPITVINVNDIPGALSDTTKDQVELALMGYVNAPKKVIVYCMGITESAESDAVNAAYTKALDAIETVKFNYMAIPTVEKDGKAESIAAWVKEQRKKGKKCHAVLPNTASDDEGIINYAVDNNERIETKKAPDGKVTENVIKYTAEQYCARIAGLIAGTPMTYSCTYAPLTELSDCTKIADLDEAVNEGKFILMNDGEKIKVVRGVNSLVTLTNTKGESFQKIKIVEAMDMIFDDIKTTIQDDYIGKFPNSYNNKLVLVSAISSYFQQLVRDEIISTYAIGIDVDKTRSYLKEKGIDVSEMTDDEIEAADTGSKVFLTANVKILDAIEDVDIPISI